MNGGLRFDSLTVNSVDVVVKVTARKSGFRILLVVPEFGRTVFEISDSVANLSLSPLRFLPYLMTALQLPAADLLS